jgi:hypothetical protein
MFDYFPKTVCRFPPTTQPGSRPLTFSKSTDGTTEDERCCQRCYG